MIGGFVRAQSVHAYEDISSFEISILATDEDGQTSALPTSLFFFYGSQPLRNHDQAPET